MNRIEAINAMLDGARIVREDFAGVDSFIYFDNEANRFMIQMSFGKRELSVEVTDVLSPEDGYHIKKGLTVTLESYEPYDYLIGKTITLPLQVEDDRVDVEVQIISVTPKTN